MTKKFLPTMIGVALAGGMTTSIADVTVFGHIDLSLDAVDQDGGFDDINMNCTTCSIGFKGSEDLGNGLKAIFKLDFQYDADERNARGASNDSGAITDRDQWLGLGGGFGKVRFGTISTGYKSHGAMIDPLYRTALQGRDRGLQSRLHSGAGEEGHGRSINTVRWDSVDYNGVKLVAHYQFDEGDSPTDNDDTYGIGASYSNDDLLVFADWMDDQEGSGTDDGEDSAWKVGGKYGMGMFSVMGQYEDYQRSTTDEETAWHVAGSVNGLLGMNIYLGFGMMEDDATSHELTSWTLAISHNFSKRTMVYAGHSQIDCDAGDPDGPGPSSATLSACGAVGASGGEDDKTSFGIKHKF